MKKRGYTLQDQIVEVTNGYAAEIGDKLAEHGFSYRHDVLLTDNGMRFVFEACIKDDWPKDPLPEKWTNSYKGPMPIDRSPPSLQEKQD